MLDDLAGWQRHATELTISVVSAGTADETRVMASDAGLDGVLVLDGWSEVEALGVRATPSAVLIERDATIRHPAVVGPTAIRALVERATEPEPATLPRRRLIASAGAAALPSGSRSWMQRSPPSSRRVADGWSASHRPHGGVLDASRFGSASCSTSRSRREASSRGSTAGASHRDSPCDAGGPRHGSVRPTACASDRIGSTSAFAGGRHTAGVFDSGFASPWRRSTVRGSRRRSRPAAGPSPCPGSPRSSSQQGPSRAGRG